MRYYQSKIYTLIMILMSYSCMSRHSDKYAKYCYVEMESLGTGNVLGIEDQCQILIAKGSDGSYAASSRNKNHSRYGVVSLGLYAADVPKDDARELLQIMDAALASKVVDRWLVLRPTSYGRQLIGIYQKNNNKVFGSSGGKNAIYLNGAPPDFSLVDPSGKIVKGSKYLPW